MQLSDKQQEQAVKNLPILSTTIPTTKSEIAVVKEDIIEALLDDDNFDSLVAARNFSAIKNLIKAVESDERFKDSVYESASSYGEKQFSANECTYNIREAGVKYDFTDCGSVEYNELSKTLEDTKSRMKDIEGFLKNLDGLSEVVDAQSGEILKAPIKTSTTSVAITLNKK